mgnify:FL=1
MANPFQVAPPNVLQALLMGQQGFDAGRKSMQDAAMSEAGRLYAAGDVKGAQAAASRGGSLQALMGFANLQNNDRDFSFRQTEAQRAQQNADRGFGLQEKQINATLGNTAAQRALAERQFQFQVEQGNRPEIREETDDNGNKRLLLVDRKKNTATPLNVPGGKPESNNPFLAGGGTMNEGQSNAALYANRAMEAERVLSDPKVFGAGADWTERGRASVPGVGNFLASENYQKFDQARRDFTAAILRKESGAAIGKEEYANADRQYFPQPGDSASVIEQKRRNRINAIRGIGAAAGKGYRPAMTIDAQGNVVDRGQSQQASGPTKISPAQERDALAPGTTYVAPDGSIRTKQ